MFDILEYVKRDPEGLKMELISGEDDFCCVCNEEVNKYYYITSPKLLDEYPVCERCMEYDTSEDAQSRGPAISAMKKAVEEFKRKVGLG